MSNVLILAGCILIPLAVGGFSGIATRTAIKGWYNQLQKPSFNPPNWLFGPVWTVLYILMGVSLYIVVRQEPSAERERALLFFTAQLVLNFFWSIIFFYYKRLGLALIEIAVLWFFIIGMIVSFVAVNPLAGYLQIPYLCWVSFASILNAAVWQFNRNRPAV